jgi:hypothetical protein
MNLDDLDRLAQAATPGPWSTYGPFVMAYGQYPQDTNYVIRQRPERAAPDDPQAVADAAFIAACDPKTVRALVAVVRAQGEMLRRLEWIENGWSELWCPICDRDENAGHAPDCELAAVLAALPGAAEEGEG